MNLYAVVLCNVALLRVSPEFRVNGKNLSPVNEIVDIYIVPAMGDMVE